LATICAGRRAVVVARSSLRGRRCAVVAAGDYVRAKTPLRSVLTLTSIAPTPLNVPFSDKLTTLEKYK
jgi:hypothetical protein